MNSDKQILELKNNIDKIINEIKSEIREEYSSDKEYTNNYNKKLDVYYNKTSNSELEEMIQNRLPKLLGVKRQKVYVHAKSLDTINSCIRVYYGYTQNYSTSTTRFNYEFWVNDFE